MPQPRELFIQVFEPQDNSVVASQGITVRGRSSPDATVSVNGRIAAIDASGQFSTSEAVPLQEGPNLIEVIASDLSGAERTLVLIVIHIP